MREGRPVYQAVGGLGADSLLIDAQTGVVIVTPPLGLITRYFRQAHFYFFAGTWQTPLLILMSSLASVSVMSGIYLNVAYWLRRRKSGIFTTVYPSPSVRLMTIGAIRYSFGVRNMYLPVAFKSL